jgi:hypothetical protein
VHDPGREPTRAGIQEIERRADVVGIIPNEAAMTRLSGAVLPEIHHEWRVASRRYLSGGSMALLDRLDDDDLPPTPGTAALSIEPLAW